MSRAGVAVLPEIIWPGIVVSFLVFGLCAYSAFFLNRHGVFNQENVIFGSDPYFRSAAFAEGWGERSLIHPNLSNLVNPPVRFVAALARPLVSGLSPRELRRSISLCVSPLFSALAALTIYLIATAARVDVIKAASLSLLFGMSMSTIAFGSVPEHFLISSLMLAAGIWLLQRDEQLTESVRVRFWSLLISIVSGLTISNAIPLLAAYGLIMQLRLGRWSKSVTRTAVVGFLALIITVGYWGFANWIYGDFSSVVSDHSYKRNIGRIGFHLSDNPLRDFLSFPIAPGKAFAGGRPEITPNPPYPKPDIANYRVAFSYPLGLSESPPLAVLQLLPAGLIAFSVGLGFRRSREYVLPVIVGVTTVLGFNWLLHTFWGEELFLFSPHWHCAAVLALIPLLRRYSGAVSTWCFSCSVVLVSGLNLWVWYRMLLVLPSLAAR